MAEEPMAKGDEPTGGCDRVHAQGMYNNPTFDQVERLIAAVKANGAPSGGVDPSVLSGFVNGGEYDPAYSGRENKPTILLKHGEDVVAMIPADAFVVDGMLDDVAVASFAEDDERPDGVSPGDYLKFTFNAAASASGQKDIYVPLSSLCPVQVGYALDSTGQAVSAESPSCSLRDRTSNRIVVGNGETIGTLSITLPPGGKVARDFYVRFEMGEGSSIESLSFVSPDDGDAVIEPEGGVPVPAAGGATVVKFFESAPGVFAVTTVVAPSAEPDPEEPAFHPADPDDPELAGTVSTEGELNDDNTLTVEGEVNEDGTLTVEIEAP